MNVDRRVATGGVVRPRAAGLLRWLTGITVSVVVGAGLVPAPAHAAPAGTTAAPASGAALAATTPGAARTGTSKDGRIRLQVTPSLDLGRLPINGADVTFTYRVTNTTARPAYYRALTDTLCSVPGIDGDDAGHGGLQTDGIRWWIPAHGEATFTCGVRLTSTGTATATAVFATSVEETLAPTASVVSVSTPIASVRATGGSPSPTRPVVTSTRIRRSARSAMPTSAFTPSPSARARA